MKLKLLVNLLMNFFYKLVSTVISEGWRDASFGKSAAFEEEVQNIYKYYPFV